jgi:hypothetical protein
VRQPSTVDGVRIHVLHVQLRTLKKAVPMHRVVFTTLQQLHVQMIHAASSKFRLIVNQLLIVGGRMAYVQPVVYKVPHQHVQTFRDAVGLLINV